MWLPRHTPLTWDGIPLCIGCARQPAKEKNLDDGGGIYENIGVRCVINTWRMAILELLLILIVTVVFLADVFSRGLLAKARITRVRNDAPLVNGERNFDMAVESTR